MGIFVGIGNYIGRVRQIGDGGGQPIGPNDYYIITEDEIAVLTERGKHILLDKYVTEDEIAAWVKEHMVFWYDMSKPVDVYSQNFNNWQNYNPNAVSITNNKIVVNDLIDNFRIASTGKETESFSVFIEGLGDKNLVYRVKLDESSNEITNIKLKDGENILPKSFATTVAFMGTSGVTDYIGLTITQLPSGQSVPTNEILKVNPYLQDHSGNNRPLKLFNFLFAGMSGVGGYETNFSDNSIWRNSPQLGNLINNHTYNPMLKGSASGLFTATSLVKIKFKATVTGMKSGYRLEFGSGDIAPSDKSIYEDGEYEFGTGNANVYYGFKLYADDYSNPNTDVIIELKEVYPNALVTDGVDDYGQVQNLQQGVKMLFTTINPFVDGKFIYDQRFNTTEPWLFAVFNDKGSIAYNSRNSNGKTYIDGVLNESTRVSALLNKKQIITITNNDVVDDKTKSPVFFSNSDHTSGWINSAFYNSIGFDAVPEGNVTLQRVIDYVINNILNKA